MFRLLASGLKPPLASALRAPLAPAQSVGAPLLAPQFLGPLSMAPQTRGAKVKAGAKAGGGGAGKGGKGGMVRKPTTPLEVERDAQLLVSQVCGLNYVTGTDPVLIKVGQCWRSIVAPCHHAVCHDHAMP